MRLVNLPVHTISRPLANGSKVPASTYTIFFKTYHQSGLKGYELLTQSPDNLKLFFIGNVIAFVVAIIAIKGFIGLIKKYGFKPWGWYRIVAGALLLAYFLTYK